MGGDKGLAGRPRSGGSEVPPSRGMSAPVDDATAPGFPPSSPPFSTPLPESSLIEWLRARAATASPSWSLSGILLPSHAVSHPHWHRTLHLAHVPVGLGKVSIHRLSSPDLD